MGSLRLKTEVEVLDDIVVNRSRDGEERAPIGIRIQTITPVNMQKSFD